jgi:hypothetical protein
MLRRTAPHSEVLSRTRSASARTDQSLCDHRSGHVIAVKANGTKRAFCKHCNLLGTPDTGGGLRNCLVPL